MKTQKFLYHATDIKNKKSIQKIGLLPKNKKKNFMWCQDGVYLANSYELASSFISEKCFYTVFKINTYFLNKKLIKKDNQFTGLTFLKQKSFIYNEKIPTKAIKEVEFTKKGYIK